MVHTVAEEQKADLSDLNILIPVDTVAHAQSVLPLALALGVGRAESRVILIGVTPVAPAASLSSSTRGAQRLRNNLERLAEENPSISRLAGSLVSHRPWEDIEALVEERSEEKDLLLLPWQAGKSYLQADLARLLRDVPCNAVVASSAVHPYRIRRILLPVRGGPFANLSLQLAVQLARASNAEITLLRVVASDDDPMSQLLRERFTGLSDAYPEITTELQVVGDAGTAIMRELKGHQAVILGASASPAGSSIGLMATIILQRKDITTLVVKTKEPFRLPAAPARRTSLPVLVKVEKWFAENTFHSREFSDIGRLIDLKRKQGVRISLGLPALNEEATIGDVINTLKSALIDEAPLVDEIVLIDSNSSDSTRKIAAERGVTPYVHQEILPAQGSLRGKGEALWKSLYLLKGDLIVWIDTDIINPHPRFVYGIVGPLLMDKRIQYVKGFYKRSVKHASKSLGAEGGRVTEILVRPIINLFFPELSGIVQPMAGMYGGRRAALERVPFYSGYGVEVGLLLDLLDRFGLKAIAQVDLEEVAARSQPVSALSKISFAILQVFADHLRRKAIIDSTASMERTMKLLRLEEEQLHLEEVDVHEQRRPPMIEVKEYRGRHARLRGA
jgi:hypothetical protein